MISIDSRDSRPLYEQVFEGFRKLIASGVLSQDDKMPSVRSLASQLAINPNTIQRAYRDLESQGYIYSIAGKGSFVASTQLANESRRVELLDEFDSLIDELIALGVSDDELVKRIEGRRN